MILDISASDFRRIMNDEELFLPKRWDNVDFYVTLRKLFYHYAEQLRTNLTEDELKNLGITYVMEGLAETVKHYLNGFPAEAYTTFERVMRRLVQTPLKVYEKSAMEDFEDSDTYHEEKLFLFRAVKVSDNRLYHRSRVFHTPYNLRSKVSTCRYSIAGYPSLYLGTSLELCCKEIGLWSKEKMVLASSYKLDHSYRRTNFHVRVIELALKPQDFLYQFSENDREIKKEQSQKKGRKIKQYIIESPNVRKAYLLWYPLIAACSFIRVDRKDPFAAEYIIPQLLMQWVRNEFNKISSSNINDLIGIRYFSCVSMKASEMGFNYVFPTSGSLVSNALPFCGVLAKAFRFTSPKYVCEYKSISECENELKKATDYDYLDR